jgi:hypothetical protein
LILLSLLIEYAGLLRVLSVSPGVETPARELIILY